MLLFDTATALLDQIRECLDDDNCRYKYFVSLGITPAECNSITAWFGLMRRTRDNTECSSSMLERSLNLTITRCCAKADSGLEFDTAAEQAEAQCFLADLELILQCLNCADTPLLGDSTIACAAIIDSIDMDLEKRGGCYSATINLSYEDVICCP